MITRLALLSTLALLALPATAGATIVPQRSIKGVQLNMTQQQVRAKLGDPDRVRRPVSGIFGRYTSWYYGHTRVDMFEGNGDRVFSVSTTSAAERTRTAVGYGSTEAEVRAGVKRVRCETTAGTRHCRVGRFEPGRKVTDFLLARSGRVKRVTLGYVID